MRTNYRFTAVRYGSFAMPIAVFAALGLMLAAPPVFAHAPDGSAWRFEPAVALPLLITALVYAAGIRRGSVGRARAAAFTLGWLALAVALMSPLDALAEARFSAHMSQHLLLMLVAPPLLVLGRAGRVMAWAVPSPWRRFVGYRWRRARLLRSALDLLGRPFSIWLLASAVLCFWHISGPYAWAFYDPFVHSAEHISFVLTSMAFWRLALRPFGRDKTGHSVALALLIAFGIESSLLGALLVFAGQPLYLVHADPLRQLPQFLAGLSPLQDQQLAGLIMWVPAGLMQLVAPLAVFADWLAASR